MLFRSTNQSEFRMNFQIRRTIIDFAEMHKPLAEESFHSPDSSGQHHANSSEYRDLSQNLVEEGFPNKHRGCKTFL